MALALDASTPVVATANAQTVTTASFNPPAGAVLYAIVLHAADTSSAARDSTLSDSRGLTWTLVASSPTTPPPNGSLARLYTAEVPSSGSMTVTSTITSNGFNGSVLRVLVYTGADTGARVEGAVSGASTGVVSQSVTTTVDGGIPWLGNIDYNGGAAPTPGSGVTTDHASNPGGFDRMWIATRAAISPAGSATIDSSAPTSGRLNCWVAFAVKPASAGSTADAGQAAVAVDGYGALSSVGVNAGQGAVGVDANSAAPAVVVNAGVADVAVAAQMATGLGRPYFRAGTSALGTAGSCVLTVPASVQPGDVMLITAVFKVGTGTDTIQTPSGATQLVAPVNGSGATYQTAEYLIPATTAPAGSSITVTGGIPSAQQINAVLAAYAGTTTTPRSQALASNGASASTSINAASASTVTNDLIVYTGGARSSLSGPAGEPTFTGPGTLRAQSTATSAGAQNVGVFVGDDGDSAGARTVTASQSSWSIAGQTILVSSSATASTTATAGQAAVGVDGQPPIALVGVNAGQAAVAVDGQSPNAQVGPNAGQADVATDAFNATATVAYTALAGIAHVAVDVGVGPRRNLAPNPAAGTNTTGWSGTASFTRSTSVTGMPVTTGIATTGGGYVQTPTAAIAPGDVTTVSFYVKNRTGGTIAGGKLVFVAYTLSSGGDDFTQQFNTAALGVDGTVTRASFTSTAPVNATGVYLVIDQLVADLDVSAVQYEPGAVLGAYFDGASGGAVWDGTANNSASTLAGVAGSVAVVVNAGDAAVGVDGYGPTAVTVPTVTADAGLADVAVDGQNASAAVVVMAGLADVTVDAYNPSVSTSSSTTASATEALVAVTGESPTATVVQPADVALVAADAFNPSAVTSAEGVANAGVADVAVDAFGATAVPVLVVTAGVADVGVDAHNAAAQATASPTAGVADVGVDAYNPDLQLTLTVTAGQAAVGADAFNATVDTVAETTVEALEAQATVSAFNALVVVLQGAGTAEVDVAAYSVPKKRVPGVLTAGTRRSRITAGTLRGPRYTGGG